MPVLVGTATEVKLLGVAKYPTGSDVCTGDIIAAKTTELLDSWNCRESVRSLYFDTTASNTGHLTAACVAIQAKLGRALLWCACRHHIGEIVLDHNHLEQDPTHNRQSLPHQTCMGHTGGPCTQLLCYLIR